MDTCRVCNKQTFHGSLCEECAKGSSVEEDWSCGRESTLLGVIDTDIQSAYCMGPAVRRIIGERDAALARMRQLEKALRHVEVIMNCYRESLFWTEADTVRNIVERLKTLKAEGVI